MTESWHNPITKAQKLVWFVGARPRRTWRLLYVWADRSTQMIESLHGSVGVWQPLINLSLINRGTVNLRWWITLYPLYSVNTVILWRRQVQRVTLHTKQCSTVVMTRTKKCSTHVTVVWSLRWKTHAVVKFSLSVEVEQLCEGMTFLKTQTWAFIVKNPKICTTRIFSCLHGQELKAKCGLGTLWKRRLYNC
jgi:hypothetical protein